MRNHFFLPTNLTFFFFFEQFTQFNKSLFSREDARFFTPEKMEELRVAYLEQMKKLADPYKEVNHK